MKKVHIIFFILISFVFASCEKKSTYKFNGQVIREATGVPISDAEIYLIQDFEKGSPKSPIRYGPYSTDQNGKYAFTAEITHQKLENFHFNIHDLAGNNIYWYIVANIDGNFQLIYFPDYGFFDFHIVNQNPIDSNDFFDFIKYGEFSTSLNKRTYTHYYGANVDTHETSSNLWGNKLYYIQYQYRKGGIEYSSGIDSVRTIGLQTIGVEIKY